MPDRYLWETKNHFIEAHNLLPFTTLPNFKRLGKSRNAFYNFFLYVSDIQDDLTFSDFLEKFNFSIKDNNETHIRIIADHLKNIGIKIEKTQVGKNYNIEEIRDKFEWEADKSNRFRSKFILDNDSIIFEFLSDNNVDIHPLQPIFLTWDKIFSIIQPEYFRTHPSSQRWYLLNPSKYIDQYSILQFNIDSEVMTNELISMLSDDIVKKTHSFLDDMAIILNLNDEIGLEYTQKLADIRDKEMHRGFEETNLNKDDLDGDLVIDDIFYKLTKYYSDKDEALVGFKKVFTIKELVDTVINIIEETIKEIYKNNKFESEVLYNKFNRLIETASK